MNIYLVIEKNNVKNINLFYNKQDITNFMWGKDFKDYSFWKNFRKIDFSKYKISEYANLNNFENLLKKY